MRSEEPRSLRCLLVGYVAGACDYWPQGLRICTSHAGATLMWRLYQRTDYGTYMIRYSSNLKMGVLRVTAN